MAIKTLKTNNINPVTTSADLLGLVSNETGTGSLVFNTSPTLVTPLLGTPTSGSLINCTGLPLTTGVTGVLESDNGGTGLNLTSSVIKVSLGSPALSAVSAVAATQAVAGAANLVLDGTLATAGVVTFVTARNVQAVSSDAADTTQTLHIVGTNILGVAMSETITLNGLTIVYGKKAFKTITSIAVSAACTGNITVGNSTALGLPFKLTAQSDLLATFFNNISEATLPTIALGDATAVSATTGDTRGTLILNSTLDGSPVSVYINVYTGTTAALYGATEYSA
jgi:hypothetical protein